MNTARTPRNDYRHVHTTTRMARLVLRRAFELIALGMLLAVLSLPGHADAAAEPWPEMPMPPKANVQWIAQSMRVNGIPTRIMQFQSRASRAEVVSYYRAHWTGAYEHKPSVNSFRDATFVGQTHGPYLMTVKIEEGPHESSHGLISVALVIGSKPDREPRELPMMPGAHVISVVESDDPGKHSRQILVTAPQSAAAVIDFYTASFGNSGWVQVQTTDLPSAPGRAGTGGFLTFAQGSTEAQLSVIEAPRGRGSTVLANLVTKDTGPGAQ